MDNFPFFGAGNEGYQSPVNEDWPNPDPWMNPDWGNSDTNNSFGWEDWTDNMVNWAINPNCPIHGHLARRIQGYNPIGGHNSPVTFGTTPPGGNPPFLTGVAAALPAAAAAAAAAIQRSMGSTMGTMGNESAGFDFGWNGGGSGRASPHPSVGGGAYSSDGGQGSAPYRRPNASAGTARPTARTETRPTNTSNNASSGSAGASNPYADYIASSNSFNSGQGSSTVTSARPRFNTNAPSTTSGSSGGSGYRGCPPGG